VSKSTLIIGLRRLAYFLGSFLV